MAWVKLDDQAPRNTKMLKAGPAACWLWVCGIAHSQSQLTDGFISLEVLPMIGVQGIARAKKLANVLVEAGLFERAEGGYLVHHYLDHNPAREAVLVKRAEDAERKRTDSARIPTGLQPESVRNRAPAPARASHPIPSHPDPTEQNGSAPERVLDAFRAAWKTAYGYECSLLLKPLEYMQLEQQIDAHGETRLLSAIRAFFAADDPYVRKAKHPLALFLRDPLKYLAKEPIGTGRPRNCKHEPACSDDAAHTARAMAESRAVSS